MRKLISALSFMTLAMGAANAAFPTWVTALPTSVNMVPNYTGTTSPFAEGTPAFFVQLNGLMYVSNYNSDKAKAWYIMAVEALSRGKKIAVYSDNNKLQAITSCGEYEGSGCTMKNTTYHYPIIQEMAIQP